VPVTVADVNRSVEGPVVTVGQIARNQLPESVTALLADPSAWARR
jgi:hypothetical protein